MAAAPFARNPIHMHQSKKRKLASDNGTTDFIFKEPASLCNSADDEVLNSSPDAPQKRQAIQNVGHRTGSIGTSLRSGSVPEAILRKQSSALQRQSSYSQKEMRQAQKWVSEREEQARQIDLTKPIRLPPTEEQIGTRNGKTNSNEQDELILPCVDKREALDCAALRLRRITQEVENGQISPQIMKDTLQYAISVLEMKFLNRTSYSDDDSDADASLQGDSVVPPEIKRWLMQTFSTSGIDGKSKRKGERRTLRSVVHVMQAGMFVERMFRKSSAAANMNISPDIQRHLRGIGRWRFDVFELEDISSGNALKYTLYEVLSKYDFIRKYKISPKALFAFAERLQIGYKKHNNQYHNPTHAADVTQCISVFLNESGFINWLSDLEVFAMIFAGAIHDLEHTGTTNNFHTQTRSSLALLYNDKSVLENHHVSAAFRILWEDPECDILGALSKDDYKQFRELVIEMVLATDMSLHFGQIKNMKSMLLHPENMERSKAMALMMHCADINHPTRPWNLHHRWTSQLLEEFFEQGDKERELQIPISPLCDRHTTMVAQSQIGFIDYVIKPTFEVLNDLFWKVSVSVTEEPPGKGNSSGTSNGSESPNSKPGSTTENSSDDEPGASRRHSVGVSPKNSSSMEKPHLKEKLKEFRKACNHYMMSNRQKWVEKDKEEQSLKQAEKEQNSTPVSPSTPQTQSSTSSDNGSTTT